MAARAGIIAAGIAGVFVLAIGGYFANEWRVCSGLEDDYLRTLEGYTSGVYVAALAGSVGVETDKRKQKEIQDMSLRMQVMQLTRIYERCGDEAGRSASELASDEVRKTMQDVLSIP